MVAQSPTQDMPPPGGYAKFNYHRIPAKSYFKGWQIFAGMIGLQIVALKFYFRRARVQNYEDVENRSAKLAIQPLLFAEKERGMLKQMRRNREDEAKLMAKYPNWEVGKYYKEPVFKTIPADTWIEPIGTDYYAQSSDKSLDERANHEMIYV